MFCFATLSKLGTSRTLYENDLEWAGTVPDARASVSTVDHDGRWKLSVSKSVITMLDMDDDGIDHSTSDIV